MESTLKVHWDDQKQEPRLEFSTADFKNWHFLRGVLYMALQKAEQLHQQSLAEAQRRALEDQLLTAQLGEKGAPSKLLVPR